MSGTIADVKVAVRSFLRAEGRLVPAATSTSQREHLEVWHIGSSRRAVGFEMDHDTIINFWVTTMNVPPNLPESIAVARKTPKGRVWTDANGKGANSNLSSYADFPTRPVARLGVTRSEDAKLILEHLNR